MSSRFGTWPPDPSVSVCALQRSTVVLGCDHRTTINCSFHGHVQSPLVRVPSTPLDEHPGTLYLLRFVIRQSHWEPLGRCWSRFCSDWQMCIGHDGIHVAARAFVTFVKGRLKCLLLLLVLTTWQLFTVIRSLVYFFWLYAGWPLVWKTWKCQGIWQLSGKCQGFYWKSGKKSLVREKLPKTVYCKLHICVPAYRYLVGVCCVLNVKSMVSDHVLLHSCPQHWRLH